jgi:N-acetylglucosaminyldiphosphoundecaprenol N-acetyl-beta-D-mannosaminyltransferase
MAVMYWCAISFAFVWFATIHWTSPWLLLVPVAAMGLLATYVFAGAAQVAGAHGVASLAIGVPRFLFWKVGLYGKMLAGRGAKSWVRTGRDALAPEVVFAAVVPVAMPIVESSRPKTAIPATSLLGMPLNPLTEAQTVEVIADRITRRQGTWVLTPNLDILRQYCTTPEVRPLFHAEQGGADILVADGMPLVWASRIAGKPLPERVPGSGLVFSIAKVAAEKKWSIYLLGGSPGAANRASAVLQARYPGLEIAGTCCPPQGFEKDPEQMAAIREQMRATNPQIVYVALGFPKQEIVTKYLRPALPDAMFIGVGISLSFIAGEVRRAPRLMQRLGLEWAHRLVQEPRRLARRYLVHDIPFALFQLLPQSMAARWDRNREVAAAGRQTAATVHLRTFGRVNPMEGSEGRIHEGRHPRGRPGHTVESADKGHQQAPAPRLRQTNDRVSN